MRNFKELFFIAIALVVPAALGAKVKLPFPIGDGMVIQQNTRALLWGEAAAGRTVKVTVSWSKAVYRATADDKGHFELRVNTPKAGYAPLSITFDDGEKLTLHDVLAGDVWICGGQSNMEMPVCGFTACPVEGYNETVVQSPKTAEKIRFLQVDRRQSFLPSEGSGKPWQKTSPGRVGQCSAVGYYFAREVNAMTDIPIGLIIANHGGTSIQSWLNDTTLRRLVPDIDLGEAKISSMVYSFRPTVFYNGIFYPIHRYSCRGILFYQGCANSGGNDIYHNQYAMFMEALAKLWRKGFGEGDIPFYFVQIAPWGDDDQGLRRAFFYEQQFKAMKMIPNSGLVCTTDLVYPDERWQIHPRNKRGVGERLAHLALAKTYGVEGLYSESASLRELKVSHDTAFVYLENDYGAAYPLEIDGFELAGADRVFHSAKAVVSKYYRQGIIVTSPDVEKPVAVRYDYRDFPHGNARNRGGLPVFPFRSDSW